MDYTSQGTFLNVPDRTNPPVGAIEVTAAVLNAFDQGLQDAAEEINDLIADTGALDGRLDTAEGDLTALDGRLDTAEATLASLVGGATISNARLLEWFDEFYQKIRAVLPIGTPLTYRTDFPEIVATANVVWLDGSTGVYTLTAIDNLWQAETAWTITHVASGKTVTQSAITINPLTGIETKPTPTVA
jgi:hypothetical protein